MKSSQSSVTHLVSTSLLFAFVCGPLSADPPKVDRIFPRGIQRGTPAKFTVSGKPGTLPLQVWCDRPGFQADVAEEGNEFTLTLPEDSAPGVAFVRLYNSTGANDLIPIMVGTLQEKNETEPNNSLDKAEICELPGVINGVLHKSGEVDTFCVMLHAGETLTASIESHRVFNSPADAVLQVLGPAGNTLLQNDDHHGNDPQITYTASQTGNHFVRVFAFPVQPNSTINYAGGDDYVYRLTLTTGPFLDFLRPTHPVDLLSSPGLHWGLPPIDLADFIDSRHAPEQPPAAEPQVAWIGSVDQAGKPESVQFKATKDQNYRIQVRAREIGSSLDPVIELLNADGKQLKEADDASRNQLDVDFNWKSPDDGIYQLRVTDRFGHGGNNFFFHLLVDRDMPVCTLKVSADHFTLVADKPLEIPVELSRNGGFDKQLTVTATDLPEGVTVTEATSEPKGDSAKKVTLKLEAGTSMPFSGPIRILARTADDVPQEITATAETKAQHFRSTAIWLTR